MLELFEELGLRRSPSCSVCAARAHPELVQRIGERAFGQGCREFEADVRPACAAIEEFTGKRPLGYRALTFGVNAMSRGDRRGQSRRASPTTRGPRTLS